MNYKEFMEAVEEKVSIMSEKEKTKWIHNIARTAKEHERIEFLNSLNEKQDNCPVAYEMKDIEEWFRKVEEGEVYFECSAYEEYGEDYWDRDYVYDYYDIFEIREDLYKSFQVADDLLSNKKYKEASILYDRILSISFSVLDRDTEEWNELELEEVIEEELITRDFKQIVLNAMYSTYQIAKGEERTNNLYRYLTWNKCRSLKIEDIFRIGPEELKGINSFMEEWISLLIDANGDRTGELLLEACLYQGGISRLCEIAKIEYLRHPILYIYACEYLLNKNEDAECEKLGLEAIEKYISWLKEEVNNRTEAVVGGGYRNSYCKAAVLIATLGETLESNGIINGKLDLIEHYKKIHSRKRAFKAEFELLSE